MSVGEQLKQARAALRLGLKEVTEATKIQPWVLESLEADRLHTIMSPVYAKGFLSTYAKFLGLNPDSLIAQLFPEPAPEPAPEEPSLDLAAQARQAVELAWPLIRRVGAFAVGLAAIAMLVMVNPLKWLSTYAPHKQASIVVSKDYPSPKESPLALAPSQPLELAIVALQPTWVSVKADGRLVAQQQLAAGSQETWTARRRFELIVAHPFHVDVRLNGQPIHPQVLAHHGHLSITHKQITPLPTSAE